MVNPDFRDLFSALNAAEVRYLVVGAYAVTFHARPRFTKDLDVWVDPESSNAARVWRALAGFGAPMAGIRPEDFTNPDVVFQIGIAPNRIDILTRIEGVEFARAWERRVQSEYGDCGISILSREDLLTNKRAVDRPQDRLDVEALEASATEPAPPARSGSKERPGGSSPVKPGS
jgi:hypothetical protein